MGPEQTIKEIQRDYFHLLSDHLREERDGLAQSGLTPVDFFVSVARQERGGIIVPGSGGRYVRPIERRMDDLMREARLFWRDKHEALFAAIREYEGLCLLSASQVGEFDASQRVRRHAVYFDTVCVPDVLCRERFEVTPESESLSSKGVMWLFYVSTLSLSPLALADSEKPVCIVYLYNSGLLGIVESEGSFG